MNKKCIIFSTILILIFLSNISFANSFRIEVNNHPQHQNNVTKIADIFRPIVDELKSKVEIPIMLPAYWPSISPQSLFKYPGIRFTIKQDYYQVTVTVTSKQFPPNDPRLSLPFNDSQVNQWGIISGGTKGTIGRGRPIIEKPRDMIPIDIGVKAISDPFKTNIYWERDKWKFMVSGESSTTLYIAKELVKENIDKYVKWGEIFVGSSPSGIRTFITWESNDGFIYQVFYRGVGDAINIVNSMVRIK